MNQHAFSSADPPMSDQEFDQLRKIIYSYSGIVIGPEKRSMMRARLQKRIRARKLSSLAEYLKLLNGFSGASERGMFISSLTTNVTSFFRESHHFTLLTEDILPPLVEAGRKINIWSAGCSSGQEPYSIAMTLLDHFPEAVPRTKILASDIDTNILDRAKSAIYKNSEMTGLRAEHRARHFVPLRDPTARGEMQVNKSLTALIEFRQINLNAHWPISQRFDVVFFRNVAIYFDQDTQRALWRKFHACLRPGGWLLIGHSERIPPDMHDILRPSGITAYRKPN